MLLPVTLRPRLAPTLFGLVLVPLLGLTAAMGAAFPAVQGGESGLCASTIFGALACLFGYVTAVMYRGWFRLRIDASGIALVGLFNWRRLTIRWADMEEIGIVPRGRLVTVLSASVVAAGAALSVIAAGCAGGPISSSPGRPLTQCDALGS